jgi:hypothetical protein
VRHFFTPILLTLSLLSGCSTLTKEYITVKGDLNDPVFQAQNKPMRILHLAVVYEEGMTEQSIRTAFAGASLLLEEQVGITLEVTLFTREKFQARSFQGVRRDMRLFHETHPDHDLYVGIILRENFEERCRDKMCTIAQIGIGWRDIAILELEQNAITHEIGHAFLREIFHAPVGIMAEPISGDYFTRANRESILRSKWRNFRE